MTAEWKWPDPPITPRDIIAISVEEIKAEYHPYNLMPEFQQGFDYYVAGKVPAFDIPGVAGQAFDRGAEAAMRVARAAQWIDQNVGDALSELGADTRL